MKHSFKNSFMLFLTLLALAFSSLGVNPAYAAGTWTYCANENGFCNFTGTKLVRYGAGGTYSTGTFTNGVWCTNSVFGDPVPGTAKTCEYFSDTTAPTVSSFSATSPSSSLNIPITGFTASDDTAVTGYMITSSSTAPAAGAVGWSGSAPATFTVASDGSYTLYPWAKDAAGNVSALFGSPLNVTVDTAAPTVNTFTATSPSTSLNIPITAFTASDAIGVTGYMITSSSTAPAAGAAGWSGSAPATFTVASNGSYTLYPWAKDAMGHVSALFGSPRNVTVDATSPTVTANSLTAFYSTGPNSFTATFSENVNNAATNTNYLLVEKGADAIFNTASCAAGLIADDTQVTVNTVTYDNTTFTSTVAINDGLALPAGFYRLFVCQTITDLASNALNSGVDYSFDFTVDNPIPGPPSVFADVPFSHWANSYVEKLYNAGVTGGCGTAPLIYCPDATVNRAQMAIFILRGMHGSAYTPPAATGTVFADVAVDAFAADWIEQLALEGITSGCGNGNYCPDATITRAEMSIFILRGMYGSAYVPPTATGAVFGDIPADAFAADWIEQLALEAITSGCGDGNYCPDSPVTRAEMAVFLVKAFSLP